MTSHPDIDGILVVDKPVGMTSNQCLQKAKRVIGAKKAGHTGALDPLASGVLPLCFGEATKVSQFLLDADKTYRTVIELGVSTASGDKDGDITRVCPVPQISRDHIAKVLTQFLGKQTQQPSIYSALKQNGVPLYKLARSGQAIEPKFREIDVYDLELLSWVSPLLELRVRCSKGTYIRTLGEDIGNALGAGGHLALLRREAAGPFELRQCVSLEELECLVSGGEWRPTSHLLPMDQALTHLAAVNISEQQTLHLRQGKVVSLGKGDAAPSEGSLLRVYKAAEFIGLAEYVAGSLKPKRLVRY